MKIKTDKIPLRSHALEGEGSSQSLVYLPETKSQVVGVLDLEPKIFNLALGETIEVCEGIELYVKEIQSSDRFPSDYMYVVSDGVTLVSDILVEGSSYAVGNQKIMFMNQEIPFQITVIYHPYARIAA